MQSRGLKPVSLLLLLLLSRAPGAMCHVPQQLKRARDMGCTSQHTPPACSGEDRVNAGVAVFLPAVVVSRAE